MRIVLLPGEEPRTAIELMAGGKRKVLPVHRVVIVGNSGSGKTTLADELANRLGVGRVELDALYHGPGWTPTPAKQFSEALTTALDWANRSAGGWVVCGNYRAVRDLLWSRADTIIWLDYPRWIVMRRVVLRSLRRAACRTPLWNGNRETWNNLLALNDPQRSVIRWSWDGVIGYRNTLGPIWGSWDWGPKRWVRLESPSQCRRWLAVATALKRTPRR